MTSNVFTMRRQAHRGDVEVREGGNPSVPAWTARLLQLVRGYFERRWNRLDIEETPDSVKRDLGFLDGRAVYREEDRMR